MTSLKIKVNIVCASCGVNIERVLKKMGVKSATNPMLKIVKCEYDETKVSYEEIEKALAKIGYEILEKYD